MSTSACYGHRKAPCMAAAERADSHWTYISEIKNGLRNLGYQRSSAHRRRLQSQLTNARTLSALVNLTKEEYLERWGCMR
jgi:hypothetical protein